MDFSFLKPIIEYITSIASALVFLFTATLFVINKIKSKHKKLSAEEENEALREQVDREGALLTLSNTIIPEAIKEVEHMPFIDGKTKKMLALSHILLHCNSLGYDFELYKDFINEKLEALISFSKQVNEEYTPKKEETV